MEEDPPVYFYRYDDGLGTDSYPHSHEHRVVRHTRRGVVLDVWGTEKFILELKGEGKRWAYPTLEEALHSYIRRKQRAVQLSGANFDRQKQMLAHAEAGNVDKPFVFTLSGGGWPI